MIYTTIDLHTEPVSNWLLLFHSPTPRIRCQIMRNIRNVLMFQNVFVQRVCRRRIVIAIQTRPCDVSGGCLRVRLT